MYASLMASRDIQESPQDAEWGWQEMERLFSQLDSLPTWRDLPIEDGSLFAIDARIQDYDPANDQVIFPLGVAMDHLDSFRRMLGDPNGGLSPMSGYTLMRAAIEAAATAIWLRCSNKANTRVMHSLWMIVHARDDIEGLATKLGIHNAAGYKRMRARVDAIIAGRHGLLASSLERHYTKTTIINEVEKHVPTRLFGCLVAWQACSGITHSNRTSTLMFLERETVAQNGSRSLYSMTASARVTAEVLFVAVACVQKASDLYVEHSIA